MKIFYRRKNEEGFVLIATLMILVILTIIGISANKSTVIELMIAGNEKVYRNTFYKADGGTELAERLTFENAVCGVINNGFEANFGSHAELGTGSNIIVENLDFYDNPMDASDPLPADGEGNRDLVFYQTGAAGAGITAGNTAANDTANPQHTNILVQGKTVANQGSGLQMVAAYDGLGTSSIGGGVSKMYTIDSQHRGLANSESLVQVLWRLNMSIINSASTFDCKY